MVLEVQAKSITLRTDYFRIQQDVSPPGANFVHVTWLDDFLITMQIYQLQHWGDEVVRIFLYLDS